MLCFGVLIITFFLASINGRFSLTFNSYIATSCLNVGQSLERAEWEPLQLTQICVARKGCRCVKVNRKHIIDPLYIELKYVRIFGIKNSVMKMECKDEF